MVSHDEGHAADRGRGSRSRPGAWYSCRRPCRGYASPGALADQLDPAGRRAALAPLASARPSHLAGEEGDRLYHLLSLMQGRGPLAPQPQLLEPAAGLLDRTPQGCAAPGLRLQALFRRVEARAWTSPGAWPCSPSRWPAPCAPLAPPLSAGVRHGPHGLADPASHETRRASCCSTPTGPSASAASRVGYSDGANFANRFRRLTGQTLGPFAAWVANLSQQTCKPFEIVGSSPGSAGHTVKVQIHV